MRRLAGLCLAGTVTGAVLLVLPMAFHRSSYQDLALVFAALSPAGVLVFTRFAGAHPPSGDGRDGLRVRPVDRAAVDRCRTCPHERGSPGAPEQPWYWPACRPSAPGWARRSARRRRASG
ncbi:monovalent cation/H+ antiporter complex subunit F [Streptomyces sp. NPDC048337]|uniref:monovalent cation/H+ antiporter complex subunit F n=1 Tax=Streptomyces sp. NPDC048337 TaxID=3365535 RepID=UPI0037188054